MLSIIPFLSWLAGKIMACTIMANASTNNLLTSDSPNFFKILNVLFPKCQDKFLGQSNPSVKIGDDILRAGVVSPERT
jgi:hypothetical protein